MSQRVSPTEFSVDPRKCRLALAIAVTFFTLAGSGVQFSRHILGHDYLLGLFPLFNLNSEISIPTWYASMTLLLCSMLLALIFIAKRRNGEPFALHWAVLSLVFLYLSIDEGADIHATIGNTLSLRVTGITHGFLRYTWVLYGIAFVFIVLASSIRFLTRLPRETGRLFILAGLTYVGGALLMEMINGRYADLHGSQNLTYQMMSVAEESLEMSGVAIFIYALLSYIASHIRTVSLHVERQRMNR